MYKPKKCSLVAASTLLILTASGSNAASSPSQDITEARQETQIWTTYALSPYLRASNLQVSVRNGTATLRGKVDESVNKDLAKQIALGISGIKAVDNQIIVVPGYVSAKVSATRSFGETIDDATVTAAVKSKLLWSKHVSGLTTAVDTKSGRVRLTGSAESPAARELATRLTMNTRGVLSVDNQLTVKEQKSVSDHSASSAYKEASGEMSDSWITAKVKSTFLYSNNIEGSDISVSTRNGVVTLSGKLDSGAERALAIEFAQNVRGVKSVDAQALIL